MGGDTGSLKQSVINESLLPPSVCGIFLFLRVIINMNDAGSFTALSQIFRFLLRPIVSVNDAAS